MIHGQVHKGCKGSTAAAQVESPQRSISRTACGTARPHATMSPFKRDGAWLQ